MDPELQSLTRLHGAQVSGLESPPTDQIRCHEEQLLPVKNAGHMHMGLKWHYVAMGYGPGCPSSTA